MGVTFGYLMFLVGVGLLVKTYIQSENSMKKRQTKFMLIGSLAPILGSFSFTTLNLSKFFPIEPVVATFALVTVPTYGYTILSHEFVHIQPIAREKIVKHSDDGIITVTNGTVVDANRKANELFSDIYGIDDICNNPVPNQIQQVVGITEMTDEEQIDKEFYIDSADTWLWVRAVTLTTPDAEDNAVVIKVSDITERKKRQKELRQKNKRLDQFSSVISHDMKNQLQKGMGYTQVAKQDSDDEITEYLENIEETFEEIEQIINDARQMVKSTKDNNELEIIDFNKLASEVIEEVDTKEVEVNNDVDMRLEADEGGVKRLLVNLVRNAVEHGGTEISQIQISDLPGNDRGFYVADDGQGFPDDVDVLEAGVTTGDDGTGLGLSITTGIAESHGWEVETAESEYGGAEIRIKTE